MCATVPCFFYVGSGDQTEVFTLLAWQGLPRLSCPSPVVNHFNGKGVKSSFLSAHKEICITMTLLEDFVPFDDCVHMEAGLL